MENSEEILHSLEEFSKLKPRDIPHELEEYLIFVAKTGDPVYQWGTIKSLFKEKLLSVIKEISETCPLGDTPPCPNVEVFNYDLMKTFILEKLDAFVAAPFTVQRICELLTTPRKEYTRIDKYMRALEKNFLVVSTVEPGNRVAENGEGVMNGLESDHILESNSSNDINVEEMDDTPVWSGIAPDIISYQRSEAANVDMANQCEQPDESTTSTSNFEAEVQSSNDGVSSIESVITCRPTEEPYVSIEPIVSDSSDSCMREGTTQDPNITVTITAIPAAVQKRRDSIEPVVSTEEEENNVKIEDSEDKETDKQNASADTELAQETTSEVEISGSEENLLKPEASSFVLSKKEFDECESSIDVVQPSESTSVKDSVLDEIPLTSEVDSDLNVVDEEPKPSTPDCPSESGVEEFALQENSDKDENSSEALPEVVTSSVDNETSVSLSLDSPNKEMSVSSTNEENVLKNEETDIETSLMATDVLPEESLADSFVEASDQREKVENEPNVEVDLSDIQEFATSSTCPVPMDIDLGEESCQEPPTIDKQ